MNYDKYLIWNKCVQETIDILEINPDDVLQIFFCGSYSKWNIPNSFLIIVDDVSIKNNRFNEEMTTSGGSSGAAYLSKYITDAPWSLNNKKYQFRYKVITDLVFNNISWNHVCDDRWEYKERNQIVDITKILRKIDGLAVFC